MADGKQQADTPLAAKIAKQYGRVVISLENVLLPPERLNPTPSSLDGLDEETETDLRILGCELIQTAGILLKLPQVAMATGQVLFHRFYFSKSFVRQPMEVTAMGCLCCASKVEEAPRRIRDVISVFEHIKQVREGREIKPVLLDQNYVNLKNLVIKAERRVLKELGFCVHVKHPHKIVVMYLQILGFEKNHQFVQLSWNYMNDSLRTDVFVRYSPETIACACIYLSARKLGIVLPKKPAWYWLFGAEEEDLKDICIRILKIYTRPKLNADVLLAKVRELETAYQEKRQQSRVVVQDNQQGGNIEPPVQISNSVPENSHPSPAHEGKATDSAGSTPSKEDDRAKKPQKERSPSRSASPEEKSSTKRHKSRHRKKRSRSRSRSRSREDLKRRNGRDKDRDRDRDERKKDSKYIDRERDYKHRSKDSRDTRDARDSRDAKRDRDRNRHRERSLSRDRRR